MLTIINMKMVLRYFVFLSFMACLVSCNHKLLSKEIDVINDAFLTVTDTVAYYELSLRPPAPPDYFDKNMKIKYSNLLHKQFAIVVPDTLYPLSHWASTLRTFCKGSSIKDSPNLKALKKQICKQIEEERVPKRFNVKHLNNIGRYILVSEASKLESDFPIVGKVQFSEVVFDQKNTFATFIAVTSDGGKLFIEKLYILSKNKGKWEVVNTEILSVS